MHATAVTKLPFGVGLGDVWTSLDGKRQEPSKRSRSQNYELENHQLMKPKEYEIQFASVQTVFLNTIFYTSCTPTFPLPLPLRALVQQIVGSVFKMAAKSRGLANFIYAQVFSRRYLQRSLPLTETGAASFLSLRSTYSSASSLHLKFWQVEHRSCLLINSKSVSRRFFWTNGRLNSEKETLLSE